MFPTRRFVTWLLLMAAILLVVAQPALACPGCKEAVANQRGGGDWTTGYMWSILFMMSMPFTLLAAFSGYMYLEVRRARAAQAAAESDPSQTGNTGQDHVASRSN